MHNKKTDIIKLESKTREEIIRDKYMQNTSARTYPNEKRNASAFSADASSLLSDVVCLSIFRQSQIRHKPTCNKKLREQIRHRMPS